jgi:hypothetical protein
VPPEYLDPQDNEPGTPEDDAECGTCQLLSRREPSELRLDEFEIVADRIQVVAGLIHLPQCERASVCHAHVMAD